MTGSGPAISVVIGTYGRPGQIETAVRSILTNEHNSFELIIVDQNVEELAVDFSQDPRVKILRIEPEGISAARNVGAKAAAGELIAYTDDDCEVSTDWLRKIENAFDRYPEAGLILGSVVAGRHDQSLGFIPACLQSEERLNRQLVDLAELEVMGACLAIRKSTWQELGGFWEEIGAGRTVRAGEDYDLAVRALQAGIGVVECPDVVVVHHGFRTWEEGVKLIEGYTFGTAFVVGYRLIRRPLDLLLCLRCFWFRFRGKKSRIVESGGNRRGGRFLQFGSGLVEGAGARLRCDFLRFWGGGG